jgi:hypothetical protein
MREGGAGQATFTSPLHIARTLSHPWSLTAHSLAWYAIPVRIILHLDNSTASALFARACALGATDVQRVALDLLREACAPAPAADVGPVLQWLAGAPATSAELLARGMPADVARAFAVLGWPNAGESARILGLALRSLRRTDSRVRSRVRRSGAAAWYALAPSEVAA